MQAAQPGRRQYPDRQDNETFVFELGGLRFTATVGRFDDGQIGELFLKNYKAGNQADTNARDAAIVLSFALQHGADINAIRKALCRWVRARLKGGKNEHDEYAA